jgi:hypothetical protein
MTRLPGSLLHPARRAGWRSLMVMVLAGCGGVGPAVVEHPRSGAMTVVSPESEPLAGAVTFVPAVAPYARPPLARPTGTLALPTRAELTTTRPDRVEIAVGRWNLALGDGEVLREAPDLALSEVLTLSEGPAPRLGDAQSTVLQVSAPAVEEGAWEAGRR